MENLLLFANEEITNAKQILNNLEQTAYQLGVQNEQQKQYISNLEGQISQYEEDTFLMMQNKLLQCAEIERLNDIILQQQNGIDFYKQTIDAMTQEFESKITESEIEKQTLQSHLVLASAENDRLVKILFDKVSDFQSKIKDFHQKQRLFESEVHKNIDILRQTYTQDKLQVKAIVENLLKERENFEKSKQEYEFQLQKYEEKIVNLEQEKIDIFKENLEKAKQVEILHKNIQNVHEEKQKQMENLTQQFTTEKKIQLREQENLLKNEFEIERNKLVSNEKSFKSKIMDMENQNSYFRKEMQRITEQFNDQSLEYDQQKLEFQKQIEDLETDREKILIEFEQYKQTYVISSDFEVTFQAEKTSYETIIMQLKQKLGDCETQLQLLKQENSNMNALGQDRIKQIELYRSKYGDNAVVLQELDRLRNQIELQSQQLVEQSEKNLKINAEKNSIQIQLASCQAELSHKQEELENQYDLINIMKQQAGGSYQQADDYRKEVTELKKIITQLEGDLLLKSEGFVNSQRQNEELKHQIATLKQQIQMNEVDIHTNNQELLKKIKELDSIKAKYEDALINSCQGGIENIYVSRISTTMSVHPSTKKQSYLQDIENVVYNRQQQLSENNNTKVENK